MEAGGGGLGPSPLELTVDRLLRKCGAHADLLIECVLCKAYHFHPAVKFAQHITTEQLQVGRGLWGAPLLRLLQHRRAECGCSPLGRLAIRSAVLSGSQMEGFGDIEATLHLRSDHDTMFELGPVRWVAARADGAAGFGSQEGTDLGSTAAPRLMIAPTNNAGFVQVLQERLPNCRHQQPRIFSAHNVREVMHEFVLVHQKPGDELGASGPAVALSSGSSTRIAGLNDDDLVPCLRAPWWPVKEFLGRSRRCDWPPAAVRDDIRRFGVHLVPTGCKGSATEFSEWRLSFSRAEVVAAWHLTEVQRCALIAIKACKTQLGPRGKGVKSYFMKTALFWLCQETPAANWRSITQGVQSILDFLDEAVAVGNLPSFFWSDINLLKLATPEDKEAMKRTIRFIRQNMTRLLVRACAELHVRTLSRVLEPPHEPLSERQLRLCLARSLVFEAVIITSSCRLAGIHNQATFFSTIPALLRSSAAAELSQLHSVAAALVGPQLLLLRALRVAPDDVAAQVRLSPSAGGGFTWDAAPLLALLAAEEVAMLLRDPAAVLAWCLQQRALPPAERPAGLPDDLCSPRGLADLLLNAPLMARVLGECAPQFVASLQRGAAIQRHSQRHVRKERLPPFAAAMQEAADDYHSDLAAKLQRALQLEETAAGDLARRWREDLRRHWADPSLKAEYERIRRSVLDAWQLRPFARDNSC